LSALPGIGESQHVIGEELLLDAEIEVVRAWRFEVGRDGKGIEWRLTAGARAENRTLAEADVVASLSDGIIASSGGIIGGGALITGNGNGKVAKVGLSEGTSSGARDGHGRGDGAEICDVIGSE